MSEPWRNGVIEQFNDHYQQKFLDKVVMATADDPLRVNMHETLDCMKFTEQGERGL
jgi:hypothetical protein